MFKLKKWRGRRLDLERDEEKGVAHDGPLLVLVNRNSASASEIFSGAIQDYGRGLIIGEPTLGRVLFKISLISIDIVRRVLVIGANLKTTMAQFFRVNGESTTSWCHSRYSVFWTTHAKKIMAKKGLENALPWAKISQASYRRSNFDENVITSRIHVHNLELILTKNFNI